jgi:hypothetical protein
MQRRRFIRVFAVLALALARIASAQTFIASGVSADGQLATVTWAQDQTIIIQVTDADLTESTYNCDAHYFSTRLNREVTHCVRDNEVQTWGSRVYGHQKIFDLPTPHTYEEVAGWWSALLKLLGVIGGTWC